MENLLNMCENIFKMSLPYFHTPIFFGFIYYRYIVGIVTRYGVGSPGIVSRWRRGFPHPSRPAPGSTQPPIQWIPGIFPGFKTAEA